MGDTVHGTGRAAPAGAARRLAVGPAVADESAQCSRRPDPGPDDPVGPGLAVVGLATTTVSVTLGRGQVNPWIAVTINLAGYALVWWKVRPGPLRTGPHTWLTTDGLGRDRTDPPTLVIPAAIARRHRRPGRTVLLLLGSAAVGLGLSFAWSLVIGIAINPPVPEFDRAPTAIGALTAAVTDSVITSVLEECGIALLILAVAGIAQRYLPTRYDDAPSPSTPSSQRPPPAPPCTCRCGASVPSAVSACRWSWRGCSGGPDESGR